MNRTIDMTLFLLRWLSGGVLLFAFGSKLFDSTAGEPGFDRFVELITAHGIVPRGWSPTVALVVLCCELILGLLLVLPRSPKWSAWAAAGLFTSFSIYLILVHRHQGVVNCGCFGKIAPGTLPWMVGRNVMLASSSCAWLYSPIQPTDASSPRLVQA